ncbi:MAG: hypothetical protein IJW40_06635 [Clostridia bacterium]|nr:hypothetical protein [Clostridia bacterium]
MKNFFARIASRMQRFMYGRYGSDELTLFLMGTALVFLLLSWVLWVFYFVGAALLIWATFRSLSRNVAARQRERNRYLRLIAKPKNFFKLQKNKFRDRKTHKYFHCTHCRAILRVPKGKGTLDVTCPRCHKITVKKT